MDDDRRTVTGLLDGMLVRLELAGERLLVRVQGEPEPLHDVAAGDIAEVEDRAGLLTGFLRVRAGERELVVSRIPKAQVRPLADAIRAAAASATPTPSPATAAPDGAAGPLAELERLGRLRDAGVLTQPEFDEAKRKLLDRL